MQPNTSQGFANKCYLNETNARPNVSQYVLHLTWKYIGIDNNATFVVEDMFTSDSLHFAFGPWNRLAQRTLIKRRGLLIWSLIYLYMAPCCF